MKFFRGIYRLMRSILFTVILTVVGIYAVLYSALSIPAVQDGIRDIAVAELSRLIGSEVRIGRVGISPFNSVRIENVEVFTPDGKSCLKVGRLGAGISVYDLLVERHVTITYAELIDMKAALWQSRDGEPLNIQFIIDAFKPKDKKRPPAKFDLALRSIVVRRSAVTFDRLWKPRGRDGRFDANHVGIDSLRADISLPVLSNNRFEIDLRRLSLVERSGLKLEKLAFRSVITDREATFSDIEIILPGTALRPDNVRIAYQGYDDIGRSIRHGRHSLVMNNARVTLADFSPFVSAFDKFRIPLYLSLSAMGDADSVTLDKLEVSAANDAVDLSLQGEATGLADIASLSVRLDHLKAFADARAAGEIASVLSGAGLDGEVGRIIASAEAVSLDAEGSFGTTGGDGSLSVTSGLGDVDVKLSASADGANIRSLRAVVESELLRVGTLTGSNLFGDASFTCNIDMPVFDHANPLRSEASVGAVIDYADIKGVRVTGVSLDGMIKDGVADATLISSDSRLDATATARLSFDGIREIDLTADVRKFVPSEFGFIARYAGYDLSMSAMASISGNSPDDISGSVELRDFKFSHAGKPSLSLKAADAVVKSDKESGHKDVSLSCDWMEAHAEGVFDYARLPFYIRSVAAGALPGFISHEPGADVVAPSDIGFSITVFPCSEYADFFNLPVTPVADIDILGSVDTASGSASLGVSTPFLLKGRDKLIREISLEAELLPSPMSSKLNVRGVIPVKQGDVALSADMFTLAGQIKTNIAWNFGNGSDGNLSLSVSRAPGMAGGADILMANVNPSGFEISGLRWDIAPALLSFDGSAIDVKGVRIWREGQFLTVDGRASADDSDVLMAELRNINLDFIFDTLNINHVTFGGNATGSVEARSLFSGEPVAFTRSLAVKDFAYNGAVLGDSAQLSGAWINRQKKIAIGADIYDGRRHSARVDGGVWLGRDSLSFDFDVARLPVAFLQPFMSAFSSHVGGEASGHATLYGNFKDVNLKGRLLADPVAMKVDFTNVVYSATDSVIINPGEIILPPMKISDPYGNTGTFSGKLTHDYFRDAKFEFKLANAKKMLCYNTTARDNPLWYGRIFASGGAVIRGVPGYVGVDVNVSTARNSTFTFVLSDEQAVEETTFLTFSDKRKEAAAAAVPDTVPDLLKMMRSRIEEQLAERPSVFAINLRVDVTDDALMTLVMDPVAGDRILARGNGAMQISYDTESDNIAMYGKYTLDDGKYNFTLQDLIIKDFSILPGSSIAFNGDPLRAILNVDAAYRVNTNLADLDKSFSSDRELNRTNVPVDAILKVHGDLENPDIGFDIELPTLTQDVARKVRSIISTDDMMSRQVLYLLTLNRFYTPDYMGVSSTGGAELASVASSTISSQLSNILSQLTDKVTLAPSFRSDKGDFSDTEVDLALSSRLLNNRLLINGNFGYRDRTTSNTTFVGDFDIEYLLSRNGNLRLKAYNHFNDQNYYLRSALTTQGIGIVYRHDFNHAFGFLRRKKHKDAADVRSDADSIAPDASHDAEKDRVD